MSFRFVFARPVLDVHELLSFVLEQGEELNVLVCIDGFPYLCAYLWSSASAGEESCAKTEESHRRFSGLSLRLRVAN